MTTLVLDCLVCWQCVIFFI